MNEKFSKLDIVYVSLMVFGFFFGAGNLIFPIFLGMNSGENLNTAMIFFAISEIGFTMLGVIVSSRVNSLENVEKNMGLLFSTLLLTSICLALGPGVAIPRAATLPFDMAIIDYIPSFINVNITRAIYTAIFCVVAYYLTKGQNNLFKRIGKILTPLILITITVVFIGVLIKVENIILPATGDYLTNPSYKGFIEGYNTMDSLASLNVGVMAFAILSNIYNEKKEAITKYIALGCLGASVLYFAAYYLLAYIGRRMAHIYPDSENGAVLLKNSMKYLYGDLGVLLITILFILACLSAVVSIVSFSNTYISKRFNIEYNKMSQMILFASFCISTIGLNKILVYSIPILLFIYPIFFTIILLEALSKIYSGDIWIYRLTVYVVTCISFLNVALQFLKIQEINWIYPTLIVFIVLLIYRKYFVKENR